MSGFFGAALREDCIFDIFYGTDYHSHLGTRRAGLAVYDRVNGFERSIHNIENAPFRTKFSSDFSQMKGHMGIGCISDYEPQPLFIRSHHGSFAITTVGKINNAAQLAEEIISKGTHFFEMTSGEINPTELVAAIINQKENFIDGIKYALDVIDGSLSMLILTPVGIYAARDKYGKTPVVIGKKSDGGGFCACFESFAYLNLGYTDYKELGAGEIVVFDADGVKNLVAPQNESKKICTFLWIYYGYPSSSYEGRSVEKVRYDCGKLLAKRDDVKPDIVTGIPDSGIAHAIGYSTESGIPYARPFIKYTPTWPRSFMPPTQTKRNLIAKMKLI
ncbi:MAG: amidophosphoribosyltransferase, partial [Clostridia bacterium]|nr:amidophosphoribosyltransferase [Clostridia bacterium]